MIRSIIVLVLCGCFIAGAVRQEGKAVLLLAIAGIAAAVARFSWRRR